MSRSSRKKIVSVVPKPGAFQADVLIDASSSTGVMDSTEIMEDKEFNRSTLQQKLRSILTFILSAVCIMTIPIFMVSSVWFIVYIVRISSYMDSTREDGFNSVYRSVRNTFNQAMSMENSLAASTHLGSAIKDKPFLDVKKHLENILKINEGGFEAGAQVQYSDRHTLIGIKQIQDRETGKDGQLLFMAWGKNDTTGVPYPVQAKTNLLYYMYKNETHLENAPLKIIPYTIGNEPEIANIPFNEDGYKGYFSSPTLYSCPRKEDQCSFVMQYTSTLDENPLENGYYSITLQIPYFPSILKEATPRIATSFLLYPDQDIILATSDPTIKQTYYWDEFSEKYEFMYGGTINQNKDIQNIALAMQAEFGEKYEKFFENEESQNEVTNLRYTSQGSYFRVDVRPMVKKNLKLLTVTMVNEWSYLTVPVIICIVMLIFCALMFVIMLCCGVLVAFAIYRPVVQFVENMDGITDGLDLERIKFGRNPYFTEFNNLHITFKYLVEKLKLYRTFLPDHILKQVEDNVSEDGNEREQKENQTNQADEEIDSNHVASETSSLGTARSSINSSMVLNEGEGALSLKKLHSSYIAVYITYTNPKQVGANMNGFSKLLNLAIEVSRSKNGRVESFTDNEIIIGINTIAKYKHHEKGACHVALRFMQGYTKLGFIGSDILKVGLGISTGNNYIGTIGTVTKRSWQAIGPTILNARTLAMHASVLKVPVLFDQEVKHAISENIFQYRFADEISSKQGSRQTCYHLVSSIITKNDEWIYEMKNDSDNKWCTEFNEAIVHLTSNDLEDAIIIMDRFCAKAPTDNLGRQFKGLIKYLHENNFTWKEYKQQVEDDTKMNCGRLYFSIMADRDFSTIGK